MAAAMFPMKVGKAVADDKPVQQPAAVEAGLITKVAFRFMFSGPSNSGKTNLARWLLDNYYVANGGGSFFERIYLFSPTGKLDPVWKDLDNLRPGDRITKLGKAETKKLQTIFDRGTRRTKTMGKSEAPHELVIFDDAIASVKFLNSPEFLGMFVAGRHGNISCMVMTQSYIKIPRSVRMQITALAMFPSRTTEIERLYTEHGPICMNKNEFIGMVQYAIRKTPEEQYPFFYLDTLQPEASRFRRNLEEVLVPDNAPQSEQAAGAGAAARPHCPTSDAQSSRGGSRAGQGPEDSEEPWSRLQTFGAFQADPMAATRAAWGRR